MSRPEILVAEDDASVRDALQTQLSRWGADVRVARSGAEALRVLDGSRPPALVVLGWDLPGKGGVDICRKLRERGDEPPPYVVLVSSGQDADELGRGAEAGADAILARPLDATQLRLCYMNGKRLLRLRGELVRARSSNRAQASRDGLTGLPDRGAVRDSLELELARSRRDGHSVGVLLVDVDHLQAVNDAHGDAAGNTVLVEVARRLRAALRPYDALGRHDSGEFLVVLPSCELEGATAAGKHVRAALTEPIEIDGGECRVTVSVGITASGGLGAAPLEELLGVAADALRAAKRAGDGRVVTQAPPSGLPLTP